MSKLPIHATRFHAVAWAALWAALSSSAASAASVTVTSIGATGSYQFDASAPVLLSSIGPAYSVDVLDFPGNSDGSSAGLHSYGDISGNFGSRSSGAGIYDVTGSFSIGLHIANDSAAAQHIQFGFHITPGYVQTGVTGFGAGQYVEAGINFDIQKNTGSGFNSVWNTSGSLLSNAGGTVFTETKSDAAIHLFSGTGDSRMVQGNSYTIDLGVLNAGEWLDLRYDMQSFARGNAINGTATTVPDQVIQVPDQWVEYCSGGGYGYGGGYGGSVCEPRLIPAHEEVIAGYTTFEGQMGRSQASSGDPFNIDSYDGSAYPNGQSALLPPGVVVGVSVVPEPASVAMLVAGLGLLGGITRRRRAPAG